MKILSLGRNYYEEVSGGWINHVLTSKAGAVLKISLVRQQKHKAKISSVFNSCANPELCRIFYLQPDLLWEELHSVTLPRFLCHLILQELFPVWGGGRVIPSLTQEKVSLVFILTSAEKLERTPQNLASFSCLHCWVECPAQPFSREERMKRSTDSNLYFQIPGSRPTAFKLWQEMIALGNKNFVVVIFAVVLFSHSRAGWRKYICVSVFFSIAVEAQAHPAFTKWVLSSFK